MITQTFQVTSSKHSNICSMSSSKAKLSFSFTPTPNSKFEINEEAKYPSLVKSVPFKSKSQQIESDSRKVLLTQVSGGVSMFRLKTQHIYSQKLSFANRLQGAF